MSLKQIEDAHKGARKERWKLRAMNCLEYLIIVVAIVVVTLVVITYFGGDVVETLRRLLAQLGIG